MEEALLSIDSDRKENNTHKHASLSTFSERSHPTHDHKVACSAFLSTLEDLLRLSSGQNQDIVHDQAVNANQEETKTGSNETAEWLYNLSSTIPSPMDTLSLSLAILSACQETSEEQMQAALFDALGEGERSMDVLFEIVPRAIEIRDTVQRSSLESIQAIYNPESQSYSSSNVAGMDPELERLHLLRQEAMETAEFAALTKAQLSSSFSGAGPGSNTHTISRASDKAAEKRAKQAARAAAKALAAAKEAGAIVDEDELKNRGYDYASLSHEATMNGRTMGLDQMTEEEYRNFQADLLPENSKQYYEPKRLPANTTREYGEGYEIVTIPAPFLDKSKLHPRIVLSDALNSTERKAFSGATSLNPMQSTVFEAAFHTSENLLICAPTGAGKTNCAMLTVVHHLKAKGIIKNNDDPYAAYQHIGGDGGGGGQSSTASKEGRKIVYIAPMKALAQEVVEKFSSKLKSLNIVVRELTGDMQLTRAEADRADILVTTPEKWDVVTRKSGDGSLGQTCGLLILDEVHLLADERGAVIESVVARLHRLVESTQRQCRIVGLSATLPNYKDVAKFLRVDSKRGLFYFGPEYRPVPLQQQFIGVTKIKERFRMEQKMNEVCYEFVSDALRRGYQVMVFVHSRRGTGDTARALADIATKRNEMDRFFAASQDSAYGKFEDKVNKSRNKEVKEHFGNGMGIHHAGMLRGDRKLSETMFAEGAIKVLCCTATLAWGVNLPAHSVVIKGTEVYNPEKGKAVDLSILDVMQIFGRAGRPQYDTSGEAALITSQDGLSRYLDKLVTDVPIESNFIKQLADHLNAEVVSGTVTTIKEAVEWLQYTYLHVRMLKNPLAYGINALQQEQDPLLQGRSRELIVEAAKLLDERRMIKYDLLSGNVGVKDLGRVASHFYIRAESVATFNEMIQNENSVNDSDLFHLICSASEFENIKVRPEELDEIDALTKEQCPIEVKGAVEDFTGKCCVLMQAFISRARIKSFTLISDTNYIASNAGRVARALFEMCLQKGKAGAALKLIRIAKSVDKRIWWFQTPIRQFEGERQLQSNIFAALESKKSRVNITPFDQAISLLDMQPNEVGEFCHWAKGGHKIQNLISMLPNIDISCHVQPITRGMLRFQVTVCPKFSWNSKWHGGAESFWLWVESDDRIYHKEYILFQKRSFPDPIEVEMIIPAFEPLPPQYYIRIVSDSWVCSEILVPVSFHHLLLPDQEMPYTDLMNLTPLPVKALQNVKFEQLYSKFKTFNPIQTQLFHVLYHTDLPLLLGAPTGSGKTIVAEIALLRMKKKEPNSKCVYIAPLKSLARERLKEWKKRLGKDPLRWNVLELSGDTHHDSRALKNADVLVCTPEKWDLISRGWNGLGNGSEDLSKQFVKDVRLLVIDEIHLLGEERGAVLEAIVSRTRFISRYLQAQGKVGAESHLSQNIEATRIIGLSTATSNPHDLADWIGIGKKSFESQARIGMYNFKPAVRPIPMKVLISGFAGRHYCPRMATMNKPCYAAIKEHSATKPVIIFVASRRQTRLTALDLINYAAGDENPSAFLGCSNDYIESCASMVRDASLRHTITFGIGLHHAGLTSHDRELVEKLFLDGDIQVLVATATLAWGVNLPAHLVIVKGTEYFDGKTMRYVDYPVTDVLQMMGRAGRPQFDTEGIACVMVEESKKNFYKKFLYEPFPVESCLGPRLCSTLNAEIAAKTISSIDDCIGYLDWTFFSRRLKKNPSFYGAKSGNQDDIDDFMYETIKKCTDDLQDYECISLSEENEITSTYLGLNASKFYLNFKTPKKMLLGSQATSNLLQKRSDGNMTKKEITPLSSNSFMFSRTLEETGVSSIVFTIAHTPEFDEVPVRHSEDQIVADLSEQLPWGALSAIASSIIGNQSNKKEYHQSEELMADPHTKAFILIQATITGTSFPVSDFITDARSVIDQIPRLLAALEYIAAEDKASAGGFDLFCMISITRQVISSMQMAGTNPVKNLAGMTGGIEKKLKGHGIANLRQLLLMDKDQLARLKLPKRTVKALRSQPYASAENISLGFETDKTTGTNIGHLQLDVVKHIEGIDYVSKDKKKAGFSYNVVVGTPQNNVLLANKSVFLSDLEKISRKSIELSFNWSLANSFGGKNGGHIIVRILSDHFRGVDVEYVVPF